MELKLRELLDHLDFSEKELRKLIHNKQIPAYKIGGEYRFSKNEIVQWLMEHDRPIPQEWLAPPAGTTLSLAKLLERGGIHRDIPGQTPADVLHAAIQRLELPPGLSRQTLIYFLLQREELMPTGIGNGLAIPHPRNPVISHPDHECVALCFLKTPVDFQAMDNLPVHTLFIILSANAQRHLEILAKISFLGRKPDWLTLLHQQPQPEKILTFAKNCETEWENRRRHHHG